MLEDPKIGIRLSKLLLDGKQRVYNAGNTVTAAVVGFDPDLCRTCLRGCGAAVLYRQTFHVNLKQFDIAQYLSYDLCRAILLYLP